MAKVHLIISIEPIDSGRDMEAVCGEIVHKAEAVPMDDFEEAERSSIAFCKKCFGRQYFYVITTGQESKDLEAA